MVRPLLPGLSIFGGEGVVHPCVATILSMPLFSRLLQLLHERLGKLLSLEQVRNFHLERLLDELIAILGFLT